MSVCSAQLDLATLPKPGFKDSFLDRFDRLAAGEALVVFTDTDPLPLLRQLEWLRTHAFDWNVLGSGPDGFRVEVVRRQSPIPQSVGE